MNRAAWVAAAILLMAGGAVLYFASLSIPSRTEEFGMYLTVENVTGFNVDTTAIFFGTVPPGGVGMRTITIAHNGSAPIRVGFRLEGELASLVTVSPESFALSPGESRNVTVSVAVPAGMPYGNYTGKLTVMYFG
ncbi:MAG: hypothetical protein QXF55_00010 [Candidatus Aenigmatarchaeota archaeon]